MLDKLSPLLTLWYFVRVVKSEFAKEVLLGSFCFTVANRWFGRSLLLDSLSI